jgi:hypothetical protein
MRRACLATCLLLALPACGAGEAEPLADAERQKVIDVAAGTYRGIQLGTGPDEVRRELGPPEPIDEDEVEGLSEHGPTSIDYEDRPCPSPYFRYEHAALGFNCDALRWIESTEPGVATLEDVAVGDPLEVVQTAYPEADCGTAGGGEYEEYPACSLKVAPSRFAWFGGDPITTIVIGTVPLGDVYREEPFTGEVFVLQAGEFVTYSPGEAKTGDKVVCEIEGKRIEIFVPGPNTGVSTDPMYVAMKPDGSVRAECGGIHAETAPPGSW